MHAQKILESLGASYISKLGFRDVWGMVGQKGIDGGSPTEQVLFNKCLSQALSAFLRGCFDNPHEFLVMVPLVLPVDGMLVARA